MSIPEELKYTPDHEWVRTETDGTATVGITDFAQSELGDIVFIDINTVGQTIAQGEIFGSVEAVKTVSDLFIPLTAEIVEVNQAVNDSPELVNDDPYGKGWMVKIKLADPAQMDALLSAGAYKELIGH